MIPHPIPLDPATRLPGAQLPGPQGPAPRGRFPRASWSVALVACALAGTLPACAAYTEHQLDLSRTETGAILDDLDAQVRSEREQAAADSGPAMREEEELPDLPEVVTLADALAIAMGYNRDLRTDREGLVLSAITLRNAQRDLGPRLAGSLGWLLADSDSAEGRRTNLGSLGLTDILPTGGELSLSGSADKRWGTSDTLPTDAQSTLEARLSQPLLRGFGYEPSHERLTDAQRQALYDVRDFDLSRQDLALQVQRAYYDLIADKMVIKNRERSKEQFEYLQIQSERLFEVDRVSQVDVFRARRDYLDAENQLVDAIQNYDTRLDRFKILLGLPTDMPLTVAEEIPDVVVPEKIDLADATRVALLNRLELMTARDVVEDAERRVRIATQGLEPDLNLDVAYARRATDGRSVSGLSFDDDDYSVGLSLDLPLDRVRERGALRAARIELTRARRNLSLTEDNVILDVRQTVRDFRSAVSSLRIQEQIVVSEQKNVRIARLRFERGEISNRDLTDALTNLAEAEDRLARERVSIKTTRSQVLQDLGILVIKEDGSWTE